MAFSRVQIFDPSGNKLTELNIASVRSWTLNGYGNDVGRCDFVVPIYDNLNGGYNPKLTSANLKNGNFILIEHKPSVDDAGNVRGTLPPWVGVILSPQAWQYGRVQFTAYSAEAILFYRPMPVGVSIQGTPGALYGQILSYANNVGGIKIVPGALSPDGTYYKRTLSLSALEEAREVVRGSGGDFDITPSVDSTGHLSLVGNFYPAKGVNAGFLLSTQNLEASQPIYSEQGQFFNTVYGYSEANTDGSRVTAVSVNQASVALNGALATSIVFAGTKGVGQPVIQAMTDAYLVQNGSPTRTFAPSIQDMGKSFNALNVGNVLNYAIAGIGFTGNQVAMAGTCRIQAMEYDDLKNEIRAAVLLQ